MAKPWNTATPSPSAVATRAKYGVHQISVPGQLSPVGFKYATAQRATREETTAMEYRAVFNALCIRNRSSGNDGDAISMLRSPTVRGTSHTAVRSQLFHLTGRMGRIPGQRSCAVREQPVDADDFKVVDCTPRKMHPWNVAARAMTREYASGRRMFFNGFLIHFN